MEAGSGRRYSGQGDGGSGLTRQFCCLGAWAFAIVSGFSLLTVAGISAAGTHPVNALPPVHLGLVRVEVVALVCGVSAGRVVGIDVWHLELPFLVVLGMKNLVVSSRLRSEFAVDVHICAGVFGRHWQCLHLPHGSD